MGVQTFTPKTIAGFERWIDIKNNFATLNLKGPRGHANTEQISAYRKKNHKNDCVFIFRCFLLKPVIIFGGWMLEDGRDSGCRPRLLCCEAIIIQGFIWFCGMFWGHRLQCVWTHFNRLTTVYRLKFYNMS